MLAGAIPGKNEHLSSSFKLVHNGELDAGVISKQEIPQQKTATGHQ